MKCSNCNTKAGRKDKFCRNCGSKLPSPQESKDNKNKAKRSFKEIFFFENHEPEDYTRPSEEEVLRRESMDGQDFDYRLDYEDLYQEGLNKKSHRFLDLEAKLGSKNKESREKAKAEDEKSKVIKDFSKGKNQDLQYTSKLPLINEKEDLRGERRVLSEEKRRIYEESLLKAESNDNFNLSKGPGQTNLDQTQKIDLSQIRDIEIELRKVRHQDEDLDFKDKKTPFKESKTSKKAKKHLDHKGQTKNSKANSSILKLLVPILALALVILVILIFLSTKTSKANVIKSFEQAVAENNVGAVRSYTVGPENTSLSDTAAKALIDLMANDSLFKSALIGAIKEDANKLAKDEDYKSTRPYRLENVGSKYLIFDDYRVVLDPVKTDIESSEDLKYNFASQDLQGPKEGLEPTPGYYNLLVPSIGYDKLVKISTTSIAYSSSGLVLDLTRPESIEALDNNSADQGSQTTEAEDLTGDTDSNEASEKTPPFKVEGDTILYLNANSQAKVFINGKDTGLKVEEFNDLEGVNIKEGDILQIEEEFPWGLGLSEEISYQGQEAIDLYVNPDNEATRKLIIDTIGLMLREDEKVRIAMSTDAYTTVIDPELGLANEMVANQRANNIIQYRDYVTFNVDESSFEVYANPDGSYSAYVGGILDYKSSEVAPENLGSVSPVDESQIRAFHLTYLPGEKWYVNLWGFTERYINTENLIPVEIN